MKLQLDTENKTIKIEGDVLFRDLLKTLDNLFPKKEWKEYQLITQTVINKWSSPIVVPQYTPTPTYPSYPWITYCSNTKNYQINSGTYDVQC